MATLLWQDRHFRVVQVRDLQPTPAVCAYGTVIEIERVTVDALGDPSWTRVHGDSERRGVLAKAMVTRPRPSERELAMRLYALCPGTARTPAAFGDLRDFDQLVWCTYARQVMECLR